MFVANPRQFIIDALGSRRLSTGSLTMMSIYYAFNRGYRAHPMPHTLEGFKLADELKMKQSRMVIAMMVAVVFGILASFWSYLVVSYDIGANPGLGNGGYNLLRRWLYFPNETNVPAVIFMGVGFLFTRIALVAAFPISVFSPFTLRVTLLRVACGLSAGSGFPYSSVGLSKQFCSGSAESASTARHYPSFSGSC